MANAPRDYGFAVDTIGYTEAESKLVVGRMATLLSAAQTMVQERMGDILTPRPAGEDYAARNNNHRIDPESQGSDHFLALLKRVLSRGECPILQLKQIVPYVPEQGELNYQKRHHKDKGASPTWRKP